MFTELQELLDHKKTYCKLRFTCKCHALNGVKTSKYNECTLRALLRLSDFQPTEEQQQNSYFTIGVPNMTTVIRGRLRVKQH